jgi:hypothetical protein
MFGKLKIFVTVMELDHGSNAVQRRKLITTIYCPRDDAEERLEVWRGNNMRLTGQTHGEFHYMPDIL